VIWQAAAQARNRSTGKTIARCFLVVAVVSTMGIKGKFQHFVGV